MRDKMILMKERVVVAMSGGVDSSTAAAMLHQQGYDVIGIFMQVWNHAEGTVNSFGTCCSLEDVEKARRVSEKIGIPFYVLNLEKEFKKEVVDYFVDTYMSGKTPNPCIYCNNSLKFNALLKFSKSLGASKVATGHYSSVVTIDGQYAIKAGKDLNKDQSYYLFGLSQEQLRSAMFPLGTLTKPEVRKLAREFRLSVADKPESQEICFVPDNNYRNFISQRAGKHMPPGEIVHENGTFLGRHEGLYNFTIGQRKGLGIAWARPLYVKKLDPATNRLIVCEKESLTLSRFHVTGASWSIAPKSQQIRAKVKIRSHHKAAEALLKIEGDTTVEVTFLQPESSISPGQAAVFYQDDVVLGGGWIAQ